MKKFLVQLVIIVGATILVGWVVWELIKVQKIDNEFLENNRKVAMSESREYSGAVTYCADSFGEIINVYYSESKEDQAADRRNCDREKAARYDTDREYCEFKMSANSGMTRNEFFVCKKLLNLVQ
jgi:hypothetical protein